MASDTASAQTDGLLLDVIVIGAGAAGIGAAAVLTAANVTNFVVLEARQHTGGRVHAFEFGSPPITLEQGANWISGAPGVGGLSNPLWSLALKANLSTHRVPGSATNMSNWAALGADGHLVDGLRPTRRERANALQICVGNLGRRFANMTAAEAVGRCGWNSTSGLDRAIIWQVFTGETTQPPEATSASGCLPDPTYETFGADDNFVFDQRPRGFAHLLDMVADGALDGGRAAALSGGRLALNTTVDLIEYSCEGEATVRAVDGRAWRARTVLSTLPLGVLQARGASLFEPPIRAAQRAALAAVAMGNYTKIFAQWAAPWWDERLYKWAQANEGLNGGDLPSVRNLGHTSLLDGSNTLLFDLGDPQSTAWERLGDAEAQAELVRTLRGQHPGVEVPLPTAFFMTRHSTDPLSLGAFSNWALSAQEDHVRMAEPLAYYPAPPSGPPCPPAVWLSGEASCPNFGGFVHGGLLAGRRDARKVLEALGRVAPAPAPFDACDASSARLRR